MDLKPQRHGLALMALAAIALALPMAARGATPQATVQAANGADYAANELGNPWDMDSTTDIAFEYTRNNGQVSNLRVEDGKLKAVSSGNDPRITLLVPSNSSINPVVPEGGVRPIDTAKYRYLTVKITVSKQSSATVYWQAGSGTTFQGITGNPFKTLNTGDNAVTFDLGATPAWTGTVQGLYFDPTTSSNTSFEIDSVLLTDTAPATPTNTPPQVAITAPSFVSGPDYATTELGNPWDMSDASDVAATLKLGSYNFNGGILNASGEQDNNDCGGGLICGDPQVTLRTGKAINTGKYKYVTYRMEIDGAIDTDLGSIARFVWWSTIPEQSTQTEAWVTYEGYRTVSSDLTTLKLLPDAFRTWLQSTPTTFRFDPHEFAAPRSFHLDYVMLTGDDTAKVGSAYNIRYTASDAENQTLNTTFAYAPAGDPSNTQPISCAANSSTIAAESGKIYMPLAIGGAGAPVAPSGATCRWNTSGVAAGSYVIVITVSDGENTVRRVSDTRVVLSN